MGLLEDTGADPTHLLNWLSIHNRNKQDMLLHVLGPVFPSPIKSNLISDLLISDQLDVQN